MTSHRTQHSVAVNLATPDLYFGMPGKTFVGSSEVTCWLDGEAVGDMRTYVARYVWGPVVDECRRSFGPIPPDFSMAAELADAARVTRTPAMVRGALLEWALWSPDDVAEREHASGTDRQEEEARKVARRVSAASPVGYVDDADAYVNTVRSLLELQRHGHLRTQVGEGVELRGVPCRRRVDLQWGAGAVEAEADFKVWNDLARFGVERLAEKWGAITQATLYRMVGEAIDPKQERASAILAVDPRGIPVERWWHVPETLIDQTRPAVERALGGIRETREQLFESWRKAA
jgi:hypothetical protein